MLGTTTLTLLAQYAEQQEPNAVAMLVGLLCYLAVMAGFGALMFWGVFKKAGQSPILSLIPIVNFFPLMAVAGRPAWWGIGFFVPVVSFVVWIVVCIDVARKFGKETGFAVGLMFLGIVFFPILGFGSATYDARR